MLSLSKSVSGQVGQLWSNVTQDWKSKAKTFVKIGSQLAERDRVSSLIKVNQSINKYLSKWPILCHRAGSGDPAGSLGTANKNGSHSWGDGAPESCRTTGHSSGGTWDKSMQGKNKLFP